MLSTNFLVRIIRQYRILNTSTRHLITRAHEHLNLNSIAKTAVKDHINSCSDCTKSVLSVSNFKVILILMNCNNLI